MSVTSELTPLTPVRAERHLVPQIDEMFAVYEQDADPSVCLHLPAEECDHARYRCLQCCPHDG